jgi:heterodisulfide reductase subunit B
MTNSEVSCRLGHRLLSMARQAGAECLAVACPLCQINLDLRQQDAIRAHGELPATPVLYLTQILGLALGLSHDELGIDALSVSPEPLLRARQAAPAADGGSP